VGIRAITRQRWLVKKRLRGFIRRRVAKGFSGELFVQLFDFLGEAVS
jgi:hypothetical protein